MKTRQSLTALVTVLLVIALALVACEGGITSRWLREKEIVTDRMVVRNRGVVGDTLPSVTQDNGDWFVQDQLEVDGEAQFDGTMDINGATAIDGGLTNIGGCSAGVADGDNDLCVQGVLEVDTELELDGTLDADSTADIADTLTLSKATGNGLVVTAAIDANGDLDVDGTTNLDDVDIDLATSLNIDGHMVDIGTCTTPSLADGDNDLCVVGDVEVDTGLTAAGNITTTAGNVVITAGNLQIGNGTAGALTPNGEDAYIEGTLEVDGASNLAGAMTLGSSLTTSGDVTINADATGGNAGAKSELAGLVRIKGVALGTMVNGSTETASYMDDTPTGEWSEVDAGTNLAVSADNTIYRIGAASLKIAFTDVVESDGVVGTAGAQDDLSGNESIGFWIYSDVAITAGDFNLVIDDSDGTDQTYDVGAVSVGVWTWKEMNISGCDANCNTMDNIRILATAQGGTNLTAANVYLDGMWKWDADNEEALGAAIWQDGVLCVWTVLTGQDQANTQVILAENTDFFVHYESGNDFLVTVTDQSTYSGMAFVAY